MLDNFHVSNLCPKYTALKNQGSMEWLKYITLLTLFDPVRLIAGNSEGYIMLGILSIVAFV